MDLEQGSAFAFNRFVRGLMARTDKFETLCEVGADLSTAPYRTKQGTTGMTYYQRDYDVVFLVGLTELKAQISWIDSVSPPGVRSRSPILISAMYGSRGWRKGSKYRFQSPTFRRLNLLFRSDAVVVYDNPSDWSN
jgi:hypothetical protein